MALPPGTSGWVGSGFDCTCSCSFFGEFRYGDDAETAPNCVVAFVVGDIRNGCTSINYEDADITVELFEDGVPITDPLLPLGPTIITGGGAIWQKWKPVANVVYTATVTLDCGGGDIAIREFEFTIPDPASTSCNCCNEKDVDYIVISGLTGYPAVLNGTHAVTRSSGTTYPCYFEASATSNPGFPTNPCGTSGSPPTPPASSVYSCDGTVNGRSGRWYYYEGFGGIIDMVIVAPGTLTFSIVYYFNVARWLLVNGFCEQNVGFPPGSCGCARVKWNFSIDCASGRATYLGNDSVFCGTPTVAPLDGSTPTVNVFFAEL